MGKSSWWGDGANDDDLYAGGEEDYDSDKSLDDNQDVDAEGEQGYNTGDSDDNEVTDGETTWLPAGDLVVDGAPNPDELPAVRDAICELLEGRTFGPGCEIRIAEVVQERRTTIFGGQIIHEGNVVGATEHALYLDDDDGQLHALIVNTHIHPDLHRQGFATELNRHLEDWYRESGVVSIRPHAASENGAYTWARAGFNWYKKQHAEWILRRLEMELLLSDVTDAERAVAQDVLDRAEHLPFGHEDFPTAGEIAEIGLAERPGAALRLDGPPWSEV